MASGSRPLRLLLAAALVVALRLAPCSRRWPAPHFGESRVEASGAKRQ